MRIPSLLLAFAAVAISIGAAAQSRHPTRTAHPPVNSSEKPDQRVWEGTYTFQEGSGRPGAFVEHTIVVSRQGDALVADIDANGFQTSRSLRCATKAEGDRLNLYFQSYREDNTFTPYRKGQFLLALARATAGGRTRLLTYWGAYEPALNQAKSGRVYFKKTK